jgi:hypothetical protein
MNAGRDLPFRARHLRPAAMLAAVLLLGSLVACSGDGDDGTTSGRETTTTTAADASGGGGDATEPFEGYAGYESQQYDGTTHWVCHPDLDTDECRDLTTTEIQPDGTMKEIDVEPADDPPIDCLYVYPTTSDDPPPSADFEVNDSEIVTIQAQAPQFGTVCRLFVPAYRQVPMAGLTSSDPVARKLAYDDVLDAFKTYMTQANEGRGFVLIGHSQGAGILRRLVADEIDPDGDLRARLVSALLLGTSVAVPEGADVGGDFKNIPACRKGDQTGCVISYAAYPAASPPSEAAGAIFGRTGAEGQQALCVNPVELAGGDNLADPIVINKTTLAGPPAAPNIPTPYLSLPGALKAECATNGPYSFLALSKATADDARQLDRLLTESLGPAWGLHLIDATAPQGDLVEVVGKQAEAFTG